MAHISRRRFLRTSFTAGLVCLPSLTWAQRQQVITVAGTGVAGYEYEGSGGTLATNAPVNNPYGLAIGPDGALYFCEVDTGRIRRLDLEVGCFRQ